MSKPNAVLAEPLTLGQETIARSTWYNGKIVLPLSLLIGFVFAVSFSPVSFDSSEVEAPAIDMLGARVAKPSHMKPMSCPRPSPLTMSVDAMQDTLKKYGVPSSPLSKLALTQFAATRDVSLAAQAREEFSNLDPATQAKLKKLSNDVVVRASSLKPEEMAGITAPLGFWDPLGFAKWGNLAVYRQAELKHGRVCMLATLGMIVSEKFHPLFDVWGDGAFESAAASHFTKTASDAFWPAFWVMTAFHEFAVETPWGEGGAASKTRPPGDFGFDPLNLKPTKPEDLKAMQNKELNNGRLAMLAAAGIMAQEVATGKAIFR